MIFCIDQSSFRRVNKSNRFGPQFLMKILWQYCMEMSRIQMHFRWDFIVVVEIKSGYNFWMQDLSTLSPLLQSIDNHLRAQKQGDVKFSQPSH